MNVLYRMHKEHVRSKTVALKIRYEDFTTVSVQQTSEFPVSNADDLYERCKTLFAKKWTAGRGIRLLGIACQNVEDKSVPVQRSLFASADEKKAKVEEEFSPWKTNIRSLKYARPVFIPKEQSSRFRLFLNG